MGLNLIVTAIVAVFLAGGGALVWKSIGDQKVAAYQAKVEQEEAKIAAATETKVALEAKHIDELVDAWQEGMAEGYRNAPRATSRVRADLASNPSAIAAQCTWPASTYALYTAALQTLHKGELPEALLVPAPTPPSPARPPVTTPKPAVKPAPSRPRNPLVP